MHELSPPQAPAVFTSAQAAEDVLACYAACLRHWPVPSQRLTIPTRYGDTFVVASGPESAPPLLLLHGTMANAAAWLREVATWAAEFRVYAVDIIGDAGLSAPVRPPFDTDAHALWLGDVLDGLGLRRAALIGTSLGGGIALDFALRCPERVAQLALICPAGVANKNILWWAMPLLLLGSWGARKVQERIIGSFPPPASEAERKVAELTGLIFQHMVPRTDRMPPVSDAQLGQLAMPVLLLLGGRDVTLDSARARRRFERHALRAEVVLYPQLAHYLGDQSVVIARFLRRGV